jgi:uncharacterized protein YecE (DUF72 family)
VLFQLPLVQPDLPRLDRLLAAVPVDTAIALELAPPWTAGDARAEIAARLEGRRATVVALDAEGGPEPDLSLGAFAYVRMRRAAYGRSDLDAWAERLAGVRGDGRDVYVYLRHDDEGTAPRLALRLMERLDR